MLPGMIKGTEAEATPSPRRLLVGQRIRRRRIKRQKRQVELANLLYVSQSKVSRWESGLSEPDHYERQALAHVLGGSPGDYHAMG